MVGVCGGEGGVGVLGWRVCGVWGWGVPGVGMSRNLYISNGHGTTTCNMKHEHAHYTKLPTLFGGGCQGGRAPPPVQAEGLGWVGVWGEEFGEGGGGWGVCGGT